MGERQGNQRGEIVESNYNNKYVYDMVVLNCVCSLFTPKYDNHCYCKKPYFYDNYNYNKVLKT